jgi:hypothetical protein
MNQRTDRLTAVYVDLAVNIAISFGLNAGLRVTRLKSVPQPVVQRVLIDDGPRRVDLSQA